MGGKKIGSYIQLFTAHVAGFPQGVNAPVSYGDNIEALIGYFHARHYVPFARMKEVFNDVFSINISEGGIHYLLNRFSDKVTPVYEIIKQRITFITHSENRKA